MRKLSTSLQTRVAVIFAMLILALTLAISLAIGIRSSNQVRAEIGQSLSEIAHQMAEKLDRTMWARAGEVTVLAELDVLRSPKDPQAIQHLLSRLREVIPIFSWVGFLDASGKVLAATNGILVGENASHRPIYQKGLQGPFVGDLHDAVLLAKLLPNPSGEPLRFVDISVPVHGPEGSLVGVLAAHLSWSWAREIEQSILQPLRDRRDIELFVVSTDNTIMLGPKGSYGQSLAIAAMDQARMGGACWTVETWPDGRDYLTGAAMGRGYSDYKGLGWTVLARQPIETAYAPVAQLQRDILLWGAALALLFAVVGWYLAGLIAKPLRRIAAAADALRSGENTEMPEYSGIKDIEVLSASLRALIANLTRSEEERSQMEKLAHRDRLTGLPNRMALDEHLESSVALARRRPTSLTLFYLDLDGFKAVNDSLGHDAGDMLLCDVALRLKNCLRTGDLVARMGGDEFVMILATSTDHPQREAEAVATRIIAAVNEPMDIQGRTARVGCSIGGAVWPDDGTNIKDVLRMADEALYAAKHGGKNRVVFHGEPVPPVSVSLQPQTVE